MDEIPPSSLDGVEIKVSADRMAVTLIVQQGAKVTAADVIAKIREAKISRFDDGMVIEAIDQSKNTKASVEVATGVLPVDDRAGRVDFRVPFSQDSSVVTTKVEIGQIVACITPVVTGTDGSTVFGEPIPRKKKVSVQVGRNLLEGKGKVVAQQPGGLRLIDNVLSVEPLLEVRGDSDNVAPINFDGDATFRGSISEGRIVQISGSLNVSGAIEAIQLNTGGSVIAQGGIIGKQKGKYAIGGDLRCRFVSGGLLTVGKDVLVQSDITEARIACGGKLTVAQGSIFGGVLSANSGLACATLGHSGGTPTLIETGQGIAGRAFLASTQAQIDANEKRIRNIRAKIAPLMKFLKALTPQQREKATELLYEADELEAATKKLFIFMEVRSKALIEQACAEVNVSKVIHPGVTVRFPSVKTIFTAAFKGPLTLVPHKVDGLTRIILIDGTDKTTLALPTIPIESASTPVPQKLMAA